MELLPRLFWLSVGTIVIHGIALSQECSRVIVSSPAPFLGNDGEIVKLSDGSAWEVVGTYEYMYAYFPPATLCAHSRFLVVNGKKIPVAPIASVPIASTPSSDAIESNISSEFDGLKGGNVYRLANGQIWEQTESWIWIWIWVNPSVKIYRAQGGYLMKVENIDHPVTVRRLK